jgi:putative FmdB family regulatory protein
MPVYEYACEKCGHEFEVSQRITDPPVKSCPACRARKVKRLISQTSFVLKGSGWYSDLYASKGKDAKGKEKGEADAGGADKSESAPAAAAESSAGEAAAKPKDASPGKGSGKGKGKGKKSSKVAA